MHPRSRPRRPGEGPARARSGTGTGARRGTCAARRLRSLDAAAHALLIAVTGYGRESDVMKAIDAGFDHHLVKPVDFDKLRSLLATRQGSLQSG